MPERGAGTVTRLADGVYFMEAQVSPEFHGSNSGWVIFDDYVLVIDAGFPLSARGVVEERLGGVEAAGPAPNDRNA